MWITVFVITLVLYIFIVIKKKYSYWIKKGINGPKPMLLFGNMKDVFLMKISMYGYLRNVYQQYSEERVVGLYRGFKPMLLIRDPEIIKQVLIKDFNNFQNRDFVTSSVRLSNNLFSAQGDTWKILRQKLTPTFTSKKLKNMMPLIQNCVENYLEYVEKLTHNSTDHELRELAGKYTLDTIGSCIFGIKLDIYKSNSNEFSDMGKKIFKFSISKRFWIILETLIPGIRKKMAFTKLDGTAEIDDFFINLVAGVIEQRGGKPSTRKDFMDIMIELMEQGKACRREENSTSEVQIDIDMIAAQAIVFYSAGFETSSATISFMLHELAFNQGIQDRLYKEICTVLSRHGELTYESLNDMIYLHMVLYETLRKTTPVGFLLRKATTNCIIPEINLNIEKGTNIMISVDALHYDSNYFPNPIEFNPENFSSENSKKIPQCAFLSFGAGPRNCIGLRFAELQIMMCIVGFLKKFKVTPCPNSKRHHEFDSRKIFLTSKHGIWLQITQR